jgi:hypothetical protein
MIKISQIEKFAEADVPSWPHTSGKAATSKGFPGKYGKNYLPQGEESSSHLRYLVVRRQRGTM